MINIRQNTFETNSSSTHSLVIFHEDWDGVRDKYTFDRMESFTGNYYGRGYPKILATTESKINYIWSAVISLYYYYDYTTKKDIYKDDFFYWKDVLQEMAPNAVFTFPKGNTIFDIGVDHVGNLSNFFKKCKENPQILQDLIFEDNSFIVVEGDEYCQIISAFCPDSWKNEEKLINLNNRYKLYVKGN